MRLFFPKYHFDSAYAVPYEKLYAAGYRGVIFDIDNTLVGHDEPADERTVKLFEMLINAGFKTCILSNNGKFRAESFADKAGSVCIYDAGKPLTSGYKKALKLMGLPADKVISIGDQIFTDICGSNLAGIDSILVNPLKGEIKLWIKAKRILEKPVLWMYSFSEKKRENNIM